MSMNQSDQAAVKRQQEASQAKEEKANKQQRFKSRRRIFPIWLRIIVVISLSAIALLVGLMIGYGVIGDGNVLDVLKKATWQHIVDIVNTE